VAARAMASAGIPRPRRMMAMRAIFMPV
jgi:hypothetical protein